MTFLKHQVLHWLVARAKQKSHIRAHGNSLRHIQEMRWHDHGLLGTSLTRRPRDRTFGGGEK